MSKSTPASFSDLMQSRYSPRKFLPEPVPPADIRGVLEDAQTAPSGSNTQPWQVHIVAEPTRVRLSEAMVAAHDAGQRSLDFTEEYGDGVHRERAQHLAGLQYGRRGIAHSDHEGRTEVMRENLRYYGAPHAAPLFMPLLGDGVRAAGDLGMYAQNFLLSLTARGYQGIPQTALGMYADTVCDVLGLPPGLKLLFGIPLAAPTPPRP